MPIIVQREKGNASVLPLQIGRNLTVKSSPVTVIDYVCYSTARSNALIRKKKCFCRKDHCVLCRGSAEIGRDLLYLC